MTPRAHKDHRGFWLCRLCGLPVPDDAAPPGQGERDHPMCARKAEQRRKRFKQFIKGRKARC